MTAPRTGGRMGPSLRRIRKRVCSFVGPDVPIGPLWAADSRPYRRIAACSGRVRTPAPAEYRERVCLCVGAGPRPARGRTLCAPTVETARSHNQDRSPHPPHFARHLPLKGKACGRPRGSPLHKKQTGSVGSANPGAEAEPQQSQFSSRSGPWWGRTGPRSSTPDFARRKDSAWPKG